MRRSVIALALAFSSVLTVGTHQALALGSVSEPIPALAATLPAGTCGFSVTTTQRDPRTLTTWTDRRGSTVLQTLRTRTSTLFEGGPGGAMLLDESSLVTVKPNGDGSSTIVFAGRGAIWGTVAGLNQSFFEWVTGVVVMRGTFDLRSGVLTVSSKRIFGQSTPLCESLASGLKPRH